MLPRIAVGLVLAWCIGHTNSEIILHPQRYKISSRPFQPYNAQQPPCFTLSPSDPVATLDYGTDVSGFPFVDVDSLSAPVQLEARYSEAKDGLEQPFGDGPWVFSNGLSNTFRVETFNITESDRLQSFFQQGGLRWQRLRLLNPDRTVRICTAALRSLNDQTEVDALPGYFESSSPIYNEIWALGPRTVQQACIAKGGAPSTWEVTPDGVLLRGQQSAQSAFGTTYANYTMTFLTKIVRGGSGWRVANGIAGHGPSFLLTTKYSPRSRFLNTNETLTPPNILAVNYGWNLVNQTGLTCGQVLYYPLSFDLQEGEWIRVSTTIQGSAYSVSINNSAPIIIPFSQIHFVSHPMFSAPDRYTGTWGFGPYQDQLAYVKDVEVHARNGTLLYHNPMTSASVLEEYGVMSNERSLCLDGAKRDRLVWSGDFTHTQRIISTSTHRSDFARGTLAYLFDRQELKGPFAGYFAMSPAMGQSAKYTSVYKSYGLIDYQMLLLVSFARFHLDTADDVFVRKYWPQVKRGTEVLLQLIDETSGLVSSTLPGAFFLGDNNGTAPSALLVYTLNSMARVAEAVNDTRSSSRWKGVAATVSKTVNDKLWNMHLGTYSASLASSSESTLPGTAWALLSNVANTSQAISAIEALSSLRLGIGYKTSSDTADSDPSTNLSPNLSGFLLEALFQHARRGVPDQATSEAIAVLLNRLWSAMVTQDEYYTGTSWEYIYPDGRPGLDLFTSHAHPWGAAPTYVLTEYVLGIQPSAPGFAEWRFWPTVAGTGLEWAKGRVPTPHGPIKASWTLSGNAKKLSVQVCGPSGTRGRVNIPLAAKSCTVNGERQDCGEAGMKLEVEGGMSYQIVMSLSRAVV
ncbi:Six-hairpin glycosidase-like protein [Aspergillus floccosus]